MILSVSSVLEFSDWLLLYVNAKLNGNMGAQCKSLVFHSNDFYHYGAVCQLSPPLVVSHREWQQKLRVKESRRMYNKQSLHTACTETGCANRELQLIQTTTFSVNKPLQKGGLARMTRLWRNITLSQCTDSGSVPLVFTMAGARGLVAIATISGVLSSSLCWCFAPWSDEFWFCLCVCEQN